ncbi:MAG: amidohydrolase family protein [Clostridiales bacterium]|nr:amidohydrolase family protein [Clostridiales bacterium]
MINFHPDYKIIDMHTHMGLEYCLYYESHDADGIVRYMDEVGIEMILSAPVEDLMDGSSRRAQIHDAMRRYPDRIKGYYCVNPQLGYSPEGIAAAFREHPGYVGLKFLPDYHRVNLTDDVYRPAFEYADRERMLVLSHTWGVSMNGESCNSADKVVSVLDRYPNVVFLMGHSCQGQVDLAIDIARSYPNAYLDLCDTGRLNGVVEKMVRLAGAEKVVFGTDVPMQGFCFQLGCVLGARIGEEEKRLILRGNALRILRATGRVNIE